jgi:hypothetical protein
MDWDPKAEEETFKIINSGPHWNEQHNRSYQVPSQTARVNHKSAHLGVASP